MMSETNTPMQPVAWYDGRRWVDSNWVLSRVGWAAQIQTVKFRTQLCSRRHNSISEMTQPKLLCSARTALVSPISYPLPASSRQSSHSYYYCATMASSISSLSTATKISISLATTISLAWVYFCTLCSTEQCPFLDFPRSWIVRHDGAFRRHLSSAACTSSEASTYS